MMSVSAYLAFARLAISSIILDYLFKIKVFNTFFFFFVLEIVEIIHTGCSIILLVQARY